MFHFSFKHNWVIFLDSAPFADSITIFSTSLHHYNLPSFSLFLFLCKSYISIIVIILLTHQCNSKCRTAIPKETFWSNKHYFVSVSYLEMNVTRFLLSLFPWCCSLRQRLCRCSFYIDFHGRKHFSPVIFCTHTSFITETCSAGGNFSNGSCRTKIDWMWGLHDFFIFQKKIFNLEDHNLPVE